MKTIVALTTLPLLLAVLPTLAAAASHLRHPRCHNRHGCAARHRSSSSASCAGADALPTAATLHEADMATFCLINQERTRAGLRPLHSNPQLHNAARGHSDNMVALDYFDHTSPDGGTMVTRIFSSGYAGPGDSYMLGENIALGQGSLGTPRSIVAAWMRSPGHRANILNSGFRDTGIGITPTVPSSYGGGAGGTYTEDFGTVNGH